MHAKRRLIGYWVTTGLLAALFLAGGLAELAAAPATVAATRALGYPDYVIRLLGFWKLMAVPALLAPRFPRLKEWAYAGAFFDLTGAAVSHASAGDPAAKIITPLVFLALGAASWALRPPSRSWQAETTGTKERGTDAVARVEDAPANV
jgi:hypothetical protein